MVGQVIPEHQGLFYLRLAMALVAKAPGKELGRERKEQLKEQPNGEATGR